MARREPLAAFGLPFRTVHSLGAFRRGCRRSGPGPLQPARHQVHGSSSRASQIFPSCSATDVGKTCQIRSISAETLLLAATPMPNPRTANNELRTPNNEPRTTNNELRTTIQLFGFIPAKKRQTGSKSQTGTNDVPALDLLIGSAPVLIRRFYARACVPDDGLPRCADSSSDFLSPVHRHTDIQHHRNSRGSCPDADSWCGARVASRRGGRGEDDYQQGRCLDVRKG